MDATAWKVMVLAVLQGITEVLPVSSSGHLVLAQHLMDMHVPGATLEVALHAGTLGSVLVFYRARLVAIAVGLATGGREAWRYAWALLLGFLPAAVAGVLLGDRIEAAFESPRIAGWFLLLTGGLLLSTARCAGTAAASPLRGLVVGVAQAFALLPGISRSGSTIATARLTGMDAAKAAEFSFITAVPLLAGAVLMKALGAGEEAAGGLSPVLLGAGALVSGVVGFWALKLLVRCLAAGRLWAFGLYCLPAGAVIVLVLT